jgi:hypothetical protein
MKVLGIILVAALAAASACSPLSSHTKPVVNVTIKPSGKITRGKQVITARELNKLKGDARNGKITLGILEEPREPPSQY